jgi:hypothetical protein
MPQITRAASTTWARSPQHCSRLRSSFTFIGVCDTSDTARLVVRGWSNYPSTRREMAMEAPTPAYVPPEDTTLFRVKVPGWYAFDHDHVPVLGPFNSNEECVEAIRKAMT